MGIKKLYYNYLNNTIFDLKNISINDDNYKPVQLFHITHSSNINWLNKVFNYREHINKIMINLNYYPDSLKSLNDSLLEMEGIHMNNYILLKTQIKNLIDSTYFINENEHKSIIIAPILSSHNYPIIGIFILNNEMLLSKINNKNTKESYIVLSNFINKTEMYSIMRNIYFTNKVGTNVVSMHNNTYIDMKFIKIPISMIINNISGYFPKLNPILIENKNLLIN